MRYSIRALLISAVIVIGIVPIGAHALSVMTQDNSTVAADEVIDDNLFAAGTTITIDGMVNGDVYAFGNVVTINGDVGGDIISGANQIEINGSVAGSVRAAATTLKLNGYIGKNLTAAATTIILNKTASVDWSAIVGGRTVRLDGPIGGNITAAGESVSIDNTVGSNVDVTLGENGQLSLGSDTVIGGNLTYRGTKAVSQDSAAVVKGSTAHKQFDANLTVDKSFLTRGWILLKLIGLFGALLVGTILVSIMEPWMQKLLTTMRTKPGLQFVWGLVAFIVIPVALVVLMITLIGIPVGVIGLGLYLLALYLTKIIVGTMIGEYIFNQRRTDNRVSMIWTMMVGTLIYTILVNIPVVGWIVALAATLWVLGAIVAFIFSHKKS